MPIPELKSFQQPNVAGQFLQMEQTMVKGQTQQNVALTSLLKAQETAKATKRKENIEVADFALNILSGVTDQTSLAIAKQQFAARFPERAEMVDRLLPFYNERSVELIRNSLRTETQRLKMEEEGRKIEGFGAGSQLFRGGRDIGQVPFKPAAPAKPSYDVFAGPPDEEGVRDQRYIKRGDPIPEGFEKVKAAGVTINVGDRPPPSGERMELTNLFAFQSKLQRVEDLFDKKFVGQFEGRKGGIAEKIGRASDREVRFRQLVLQLSDDLLRLKSGAQINEKELARMQKFLVTLNLPDRTFKSRLKSLRRSWDDIVKIKQQALRESGFIAPSGRIGRGKGKGKGDTILRFDAQGNQL